MQIQRILEIKNQILGILKSELEIDALSVDEILIVLQNATIPFLSCYAEGMNKNVEDVVDSYGEEIKEGIKQRELKASSNRKLAQ